MQIYIYGVFCFYFIVVFRNNYMVSPCELHKVTYLDANSLKSYFRVLTFHFVTFGGINVICRFKITFY
ncbi:hypothetical protein Hanom_Chr14g01294971 [Helianthus anomalus]